MFLPTSSRSPVLVLSLVASACGARTVPIGVGNAGTEAGTVTDAAAQREAGPDAQAINCTANGNGSVFPTFDRTCNTDADCAYGVHQLDCCGSTKAIAFNASQRTAFDAAETVCQRQYPGCGCAALPLVTDDGRSLGSGGTTVIAQCTAGRCATTLR